MIRMRMSSTVWRCSAAALLAAATAFAQAPGGGAAQQPSAPSQSPSASSPSMSPGAPAAPAENYADQSFIAKAMAGSDAEVQLGQLAQEKSQSNDVKQFGQKMVSDHTQMSEKWFKPEAKQLGLSEPKGPDKKDKKLIAKLSTLSGPDFDTAYIQAMVKGHEQDLKDFKDETHAAQDPNVKMIAQQGVTVISQHLELIEQIAKSHNVDVEAKGKEMSSMR
jgi:putative membrane protein